MRYHRNDVNRGAAANFNRTFELARGRYFKWAAYDDVCAPEYLARCVELLEEHRELVWCHTRARFVDTRDTPVPTTSCGPDGTMSYMPPGDAPTSGPEPTGRSALAPHRRLRAVLLETWGEGNWDVFGLARVTHVRRTGLQRPYYGADKVYVAELALQGRYGEVPDVLFVGRLHREASGALDTAQAQRGWIDPSRTHWTFTRARLAGAYLQAIGRSDLDLAERGRCLLVVSEYVAQVRKWRRVVASSLGRKGTGGGYMPFLGPSTPPEGGSR